MNEIINSMGRGFCTCAGAMLLQSTVLIVILFIVNRLLQKRVKATLRYWLWMLVFIKLVLPPTFALPTSPGYWCHDLIPAPSPTPPASAPAPAQEPAVQESVGWALAHADSPAPVAAEQATLPVQPVSPPPVVSPRVSLTWQGGAFLFWLIGVAVLGVVVVQRIFFVRRLARQSHPASEPLMELLDQCRARMNVHRAIALRLSPTAFSPAVCGLLRPVILLPEALRLKLSDEDVRTVLIHELAHVKRGDLWLNSLQTLLQIAYFYNPFVWLAGALVRRVREQAVDEMVLVALGAEAKSYSRTLVDIAEMTFFKPTWSLRLIGVAESKKSLEGRIKHMLTMPVPRNARIGWWGSLIVALVAVVLLPMAHAEKAVQLQPSSEYSLLLLDDNDPTTEIDGRHDDRLYLLDSQGAIQGVVTGFDARLSTSSHHRLAVDGRRKTLWVTESVRGVLWHFDLTTGRLLSKTPDLKAGAAAVDPATGNAWLVIPEMSREKSRVVVVSPSGQKVTEYPIFGFDIDYSSYDDSFWVVGADMLTKMDRNGKVIGQISGPATLRAKSVSVDQKTGNAWVLVAQLSEDRVEKQPAIWIVDTSVRVKRRINLGESRSFCVAVDSDNGVVWVGCLDATLRFTTSGEELPPARAVSGFTVVPGGSPDRVIAASPILPPLRSASDASYGSPYRAGVNCPAELVIATVLASGDLERTVPPQEIGKLLSQRQKWMAIVPFAGAKLQSSPELVSLTNGKEREQTWGRYPESMEKLTLLGKALLQYAQDHDGGLPDTWDDVKSSFSDADMMWLRTHFQYIGRGRTTADQPTGPVAYDIAVLREGRKGTLVLYLDGHVAFESVKRLEEIGINAEPYQELLVMDYLPHLAASARRYAEEHDGVYAEDMKQLEPYVSDKAQFDWAAATLKYVGKGVNSHHLTPSAFSTPIAYYLRKKAGANSGFIGFVDGHVEITDRARFEEVGIKPDAEPTQGTQVKLATGEKGTSGSMIATLADGVTVELVGLCQDATIAGQTWWHPDGTPMEEPRTSALGSQAMRYPAFSYLVKFSMFGVSFKPRLPFNIQSTYGSAAHSQEGHVICGYDKPTEELPAQGDIEIDVASGAWTVNNSSMGGMGSTRGGRPMPGELPGGPGPKRAYTPEGATILLSGYRANPRNDPHRTLVDVTVSSANVEVKLECTTTDDRRLESWRRSWSSGDGMVQYTMGFTAPIEEIIGITIKHRPFQRVAFRNVAFRPK